MAIVNHAKREINAKIVYYGPEGSGKSTSIRYIYDRIKPALRGELKTLPSSGSTLLFFDFSPFEQPVFAGYRLRLHVYTLQGKVANLAAWKMTIKGADGVMIVADASPGARGILLNSMQRLREFLGSYGLALDVVPAVLQLNKSDLAGPVAVAEVAGEAGLDGINAGLSMADRGEGVLEALALLSRQIMDRIRERDDLPGDTATDGAEGGDGEPDLRHEPDAAVMVASGPGAEVPAEMSEPFGNDDVPCRVEVVSGEILCKEGMVTIPLDVIHSGGMQRLVVSVAVSLGQTSP